ncbi:MAG TPA: BTAD domain-containing putative transcriptional regulator [Ilumatobacteraceae bacterium]|nr:BTAD domain-containing putative transcriptional regulator [Ilumatobacteraceae bacterium]
MGEPGAPTVPLTVVSAAAGSGKTTAVRSWTDGPARVWLTCGDERHGLELAGRLVRQLRVKLPEMPAELAIAFGPSAGPGVGADPVERAEQLGALIADALAESLRQPLTIVIDDLERIEGAIGPIRMIESLVRGAPPQLRIVLATRTSIPFSIERLRQADAVREIDAEDLRLDAATAAAVARARWPTVGSRADDLVSLAGGHAATLVMAAAAARRGGETVLDELMDAGDRKLDQAAVALVATLAPDECRILDDALVLGDTNRAELEALGHTVSSALIAELVADHVLDQRVGAVDSVHVSRAVADLLQTDAAARQAVAEFGARSALALGDPTRSLQIAVRHGTDELVASVLDDIGPAVVDDGAPSLVLDGIRRLPDAEAAQRASLAGRAAQALGEWDAAMGHYRDAATSGASNAGDAWRHGLMLHLRGDIPSAIEVYDRGAAGPDDDRSDPALLAAFRGAAAWLTGDLVTARQLAEVALTTAARSNDDRALAAAYTLAAMVAAADGDRVANDWNYVRALQHAERAADPLQVARIRSNRGSRLLEEGDYRAALAELDIAVRHADLGGYGAVLALALSNRGEVKTRIGRLDEARTDLGMAIDLLQRQGSRLVAYPMTVLARLFLVRGDVEQARSACERALAMSGPTGDRQVTIVARMLLALALSDREPDEAWESAQAAAIDAAGSLNVAEAWVVVGKLALARGMPDDARDAAVRAAEQARTRADRWALAGAIEVEALADPTDTTRRSRLLESRALYDELGCPVDVARMEVHLAALDNAGIAAGRLRAVTEVAHRVGARTLSSRADQMLRAIEHHDELPMRALVLGAFALTRDGDIVPNTAWQSRKARDLFKMLLTRRGRPLAREQAMERLWPDDDDPKLANRLSVAVATVRSVLDPGKAFDGEYFVKADGDSLRVDLEHVELDADRFLVAADAALVEHRRGDGEAATGMLASAEALYTGDVLEDDPYVDWHVALREEARAAYLAVAAALADRRVAGDDPDAAIRLLLRLLEREPYDETSHVRLVALLSRSGRHGEARRRFQHYVDRMRELELEPRSFAATIGDSAVDRRRERPGERRT